MKKHPYTPAHEEWSADALQAGAAARELSETGGKSDISPVRQPKPEEDVTDATINRLWSAARWAQEIPPEELAAGRERLKILFGAPTNE